MRKIVLKVIFIIPVFVLMMGVVKDTQAKTIKSLFMPGPVITGHVKYENKCSTCHKSFSKGSQKSLCLDCHKKVSFDVKKGRGFHGRENKAKNVECRHCHKEHKGRKYRAVIFDSETFDHKSTDFVLKGGHLGVKCAKCHKKEKKYREAPSKCKACHNKDDVHKGKLGKDCAKCHDARSWTKARFKHEKTDFPLKFKHKKVTCGACHPGGRYKKTPLDCYTCHVINDVHNKEYGKKCKDCHTARSWKKFKFDHEKTDFPLKFRHKKVDCNACHKGKFYGDKKTGKIKKTKKIKKVCFDCHKDDDEHKGRYGKKCKSCHSPKSWASFSFNHDKTKFALKDKHRKVACAKCHRGRAYGVKKVRTCDACHGKDDIHRGREGRDCASCHNQRGWGKDVVFDHDITKFPLIGLHAVTLCEQCHDRADYKRVSVKCNACHKDDDKHKGGLGKECGVCHNPNGWRLWSFDHEAETKYKLDGKHKGLTCGACHKKNIWKKDSTPSDCFSCHNDDDTHRGAFGLNCRRCHTTESFREITISY